MSRLFLFLSIAVLPHIALASDDINHAARTPLTQLYTEAAQKISALSAALPPLNGSLNGEPCGVKYFADDYQKYSPVIATYQRYTCPRGTMELGFFVTVADIEKEVAQKPDWAACSFSCRPGSQCLKRVVNFRSLGNKADQHHDSFALQTVQQCDTLRAMLAKASEFKASAASALQAQALAIPCAPPPAVSGASADESKAIYYALQGLDLAKLKACITRIDLVDKVKMSFATIAKIKIHLLYPNGLHTHCFSSHPLPDLANCAGTGDISDPKKPGATVFLAHEVPI